MGAILNTRWPVSLNDATGNPSPRELELADDLNAALPRIVEHRLFERHAGACDDQVGACERGGLMTTELERHAGCRQSLFAFEPVPRFGEGHCGPPASRQFRGRNTASCRTHNHDPPPSHRESSRIHAITAASALSG